MGFGCRSPPPIGGMKSEVGPTRLAAAREVPAVRRAGAANRHDGDRPRPEGAAAIVAGATLGAQCAARPMMTAAGSVITAPMSLTQGDCPAAPYFPNGIWVPLPAPHRRHEERS